MRGYPLFLLGTLVFFAILLGWMAWSRFEDFDRHHRTVARQTLSGLADEIARSIANRKRLVLRFAEEQHARLTSLIHDPESTRRYRVVSGKLRKTFPDYFAFTLANPDGELYIEDFGEQVGDLCRQDIRDYARHRTNRPRIHPGPRVYHFDILARLDPGPRSRILFVSFQVDLLASILRNAQPPEHELYLVLPGDPPLIEVTDRGARNHLVRHDYHLTADEQRRLLASMPVAGTRWAVIDLHRPGLYRDFARQLLAQSLLMFAPFLLFTLIMWWLFRRQERLRQQAEVARDEFLATVSHELRTPLTAIHGALGLLASGTTGALDERASEMVRIARRNSDRLIRLVNDLLDMRRLESGNLELDVREIDLVTVIRQAIDENQGYLAQFGVTCTFEPDRESIPVRGDHDRLIQVLTNLLSNAAKYGPPNETVRIRTRCANGRVRVSIIDRGEGIPPEFRPHLFEKFARHDSSDARAVSGTGLGLSIARAIVQAHRGRMGFHSYHSVGTTFYFELPLQDRAEGRVASGEAGSEEA